MEPETIICVWDKDGKFFQWWNNVEHGKDVAKRLGYTYLVIGDKDNSKKKEDQADKQN